MKERIKIAITQGDINGVGYEIILKSFQDKYLYNFCIPILYGSPKVLGYYKKVLKLEQLQHNTIRHVSEAKANQLNVIACNDDNVKVELGQPTKEAGVAAFEALERAVNDLKDGLLSVLVTAPINKETIQSEQFAFSGHTEYLAERWGTKEVIMLMVQDNLRVAVVTGHMPLGEVAAQITQEQVYGKLETLHEAMRYDFGIPKPKIAVLGLNPHAGDNGFLGKEEQDVLLPVLEKARAEGILAMGVYAADGFFGSGNFKKFDAILAMYHDQGLIPFKTLASKAGVNFTAGLPVVRTSPAHGTAYDLVGRGTVSETSFKEAVYEAISIHKTRCEHDALTENVLEVSERPQRRSYRPKIS